MLKNWIFHADYRHIIVNIVSCLNENQLKRLSSLQFSLDNLTTLNLATLKSILKPYYSLTGRPALNQPEIFRLFVLIMEM